MDLVEKLLNTQVTLFFILNMCEFVIYYGLSHEIKMHIFSLPIFLHFSRGKELYDLLTMLAIMQQKYDTFNFSTELIIFHAASYVLLVSFFNSMKRLYVTNCSYQIMKTFYFSLFAFGLSLLLYCSRFFRMCLLYFSVNYIISSMR